MLSLGPLAFLTPWILAALIALPILWWLLRAVPPAPAKRFFPGVRLLLGLRDPERIPERTPWWLLALRMAALGAAIFAFADPVLNPRSAGEGSGPVLVLLDGGWASAPDWAARQARATEVLERAERAGRPAALHVLTETLPPGEGLVFGRAQEQAERIPGLVPAAWSPDRAVFADWLEDTGSDGFSTVWLTDGLEDFGTDALLDGLVARGDVTLIRGAGDVLALTAPRFASGMLQVDVLRADDVARPSVPVAAIGPDPQGIERTLGEARVLFEPGETRATAELDLPLELRNRVTRIALPGVRSAGAVVLADDGLQRRKVGLVAGRSEREGAELVSQLHYLRTALEPSAELVEAPLGDILSSAPDVIILADVGTVADTERDRLVAWVDEGGLLVRFAGPRLAQSGQGQIEEDPLLPVRLRAGGRTVGGAMSWGAPKTLRPFPETSPFVGLEIPVDVDVSSQVMAQPDPSLPQRVLAALDDGTPLVTGRNRGDGRIVLFHVTANAEWSSLPLSGLFVEMLERLAVSTRADRPEAAELEGQLWSPVSVLNGYGELTDPALLAGVDGARLIGDRPGPDMPPGIYAAGDRRVAVNLFAEDDQLSALTDVPTGVAQEGMGVEEERLLKPIFLILALAFLAADVLATLWVAGRLAGTRVAAVLLAGMVALPGDPAAAQDRVEDLALRAANETVLAYVITGETRTDNVSAAGLSGLSLILNRRTAIEPAEPIGVDVERDPLSLFPFLYWPVTETQRLPSDAAYAKLNDYLRSGGMILFDTRDSYLGGTLGSGTPNGRMLQRIAQKLDIPPLERVPGDHVLTRTFYLLQDFPGRYSDGPVWVETSPDAEAVEGMPFRNLNDGVSPVVIGGNDWAAAWAVDANGTPMFPVGRGTVGAQQREIAFRFGVNLLMYVMTGNYKSDQVHVPALLERLGQ